MLFNFAVNRAADQVQIGGQNDDRVAVDTSTDPSGADPVEQEPGVPVDVNAAVVTPRSLPGPSNRTSPYDIAPLPQASNRVEGGRKRKSESATVLTSTPHKEYLNSLGSKKQKVAPTATPNKPDKRRPRHVKKLILDPQGNPKKPKKNNHSNTSCDNTPCCMCGKRFNEPPIDSWTQCPNCNQWYHDSCGPEDTVLCFSCAA